VDATKILATCAALILYAALSGRLRRSPLSLPIVFTAAGLLIGPEVLGIVELGPDSPDVKLLAEVTLSLVLFADAYGIQLRNLRAESAVAERLLGIGLPLTIVVGAGAALLLFGGIGIVAAVLVSAILAPTDASLGQAVVTDRRIPGRVRRTLNVESGLNDGLVVPVFLAALGALEVEAGEESGGHFARLLVEQIGFGALAGVVAGTACVWLLSESRRRGWIDETWGLILTLATPALAYALALEVEGSGFIAAYVAGLAFGHGVGDREGGPIELSEQLGQLLGAVTWLAFGAVLLSEVLDELSLSILAYAVLSLTIVRMGPVFLALAGSGIDIRTRAFMGWFGPRGLASLVFALLAFEESIPHGDRVLAIAGWTVALSVVAHGVTARWLTGLYVKRLGREGR
jgi:NhaP-type Na+/H+ or K+/H+ antiporter